MKSKSNQNPAKIKSKSNQIEIQAKSKPKAEASRSRSRSSMGGEAQRGPFTTSTKVLREQPLPGAPTAGGGPVWGAQREKKSHKTMISVKNPLEIPY